MVSTEPPPLPLPATLPPVPLAIVHGWHDEIVPWEDSLKFAQERRAALHLLDADHGLHGPLPEICALLAQFLALLDAPVGSG